MWVKLPNVNTETIDAAAVREAIRRQQESTDDHDLSLIVERLQRTPGERLRDLQSLLAFIERVRPGGPLVDWV